MRRKRSPHGLIIGTVLLLALAPLPASASAFDPEKEANRPQARSPGERVFRIHLQAHSTHQFRTQTVGRREMALIDAKVGGRALTRNQTLGSSGLQGTWREHGVLLALSCRKRRAPCVIRLANFRSRSVKVRISVQTPRAPQEPPAEPEEPEEIQEPEEVQPELPTCQTPTQFDCNEPPGGWPEYQTPVQPDPEAVD